MKKVFLAYADANMAYSLKRIGRQAKRLGFFDEVMLMTPDDLSDEFRNTPLMKHSYGGGYWSWKPWLIWNALQKYDDALVCYVDAGCTLNKAPEWQEYLNYAEKYETILYEYPDEMPVWVKFGTSSTKIKHWCKKEALLYYDELTGGTEWREHNKILGGFVWARCKDNPVIKAWLDVVVNHPEVIDDTGIFEGQFPFFVRHKHDQPLLTALSQKYSETTLVLPELLDEGPADAAVVAERVRVKSFGDYCIWCVKKCCKKVLSPDMVARMKSLIIKK